MGEFALADNVLFVGHSLVGPEMPVMVEDLVEAAGGTGRIRVQIINGAPLVWNWQHSAEAEGVDGRAELAKGQTDALVLTEAIPLAASITWNDTDAYAYRFYHLAQTAKPGTRVFLYETWHSLDSGPGATVPHDDNAGIPWRKRLAQDLPRWEGVVASVNARRQADEPAMRLVPAGQAMARLDDEIGRGRVPGLTDVRQLFCDDIHPNSIGNYFVALVQYATLYGRSPVGLPVALKDQWGQPFEAPSPRLAARLQQIAWDAVRAYRSPVQKRADAGIWPVPDQPADLIPARADLETAPRVAAHAAEAPANPPLGMGLNGLSDWSTEQPFIDIMKTARPWIGHLPGQWDGWNADALRSRGYLDPQGWPTAMPPELTGISTLVLTDQPEGSVSLAGRYRLTYDGAGSIDLDGRVANVVRHRGEIWFDYAPGAGSVMLTITATDPAHKGQYLRNIRIVKAENIDLLEAGALFNPAWLARIEGLRALRFMDWMATNGSTIADWSERPLPGDYTYGWRGAPVEVMVALANQTAADPWFTLPHRANDGYVRGFAELVRDSLDPRRKTYVEYSNETWNWGFDQAHWLQDQAKARWGAAAGGDAWMQFAGMQVARIAQIWDTAFGAAAHQRLVKVIATQTGWLGLEQPLLDAPLWVAEDPAHNRAPATYVDAYAVTGYFGGPFGFEKAPAVKQWIAASTRAAEAAAAARGLTGTALSRDVAAHRLDAAIAEAAADLRDGSVTGNPGGTLASLLGETLPYQAGVARSRGLALVMYEGGTHATGGGDWVDDDTLTDFFVALNYSPEMADLYRQLLSGWQQVGGTLFNAFVDVAGPSKWGSWGALRTLDDANPRWDALRTFNQVTSAWWEVRPAGSFEPGATVIGTGASETLRGGQQADILLGRGGNDTLAGGGGDDRLHGGPGRDLAILPGGREDWRFATEGDALVAQGPTGRVRLVAIEEIGFSAAPGQSITTAGLP